MFIHNKMQVIALLKPSAKECQVTYTINQSLIEDNGSLVVETLQHQGKKYSRILIPHEVRSKFDATPSCERIGDDNTDMFGNIIADRYNIYRSGFSDALAIIFNVLLEFRILCSGRGEHFKKITVAAVSIDDIDFRVGKTLDGSLWEPSYKDDHHITLNRERPKIRNLFGIESNSVAGLLFYLGAFESAQYSEA
jgi:hypothetical protein